MSSGGELVAAAAFALGPGGGGGRARGAFLVAFSVGLVTCGMAGGGAIDETFASTAGTAGGAFAFGGFAKDGGPTLREL